MSFLERFGMMFRTFFFSFLRVVFETDITRGLTMGNYVSLETSLVLSASESYVMSGVRQ
jgi:hypothetical protein